MSTYNLDSQKAKDGSGRVSNRIDQTGAYTGIITVAKEVTAQTGTTGIELTFKAQDGREARYLTLWTKNASGGSIFGESQLHALMTCLKVKTIAAVERVIEEWDFELKEDVKRPAMVFLELMSKPIGLVLQLEEYEGRNGLAEKMTYFTAFEATTKKLAIEILEQKPAEALEKILHGLKDKRLKQKVETAPVAAQNFEDSDLPF